MNLLNTAPARARGFFRKACGVRPTAIAAVVVLGVTLGSVTLPAAVAAAPKQASISRAVSLLPPMAGIHATTAGALARPAVASGIGHAAGGKVSPVWSLIRVWSRFRKFLMLAGLLCHSQFCWPLVFGLRG